MKNLFLTSIIFLFIFTGICFASDKKQYRILILHSYGLPFEWVDDLNEGIFAALDGKGYKDEYPPLEKLNYTHRIFYMNTKIHNSPDYLDSITKETLNLIESFKPDVIITTDEDATLLVGKRFVNRGPSISFCGLNGDPIEYDLVKSLSRPGTNITGVLEHHNFKENIKLAKMLVPGAKRLYIIFDDTPTSHGTASIIQKQIKDLDVELNGVYFDKTFEMWKKHILEVQNKADFIFPYLYYALKYPDGSTVPRDVLTKWLIDNSKILELSAASFQIKDGFAASVSMWGVSQGYEAAQKAMMILRGTPAAEIPVAVPKIGSVDINLARLKMLNIKVPFDILTYATVYEKMKVKP